MEINMISLFECFFEFVWCVSFRLFFDVLIDFDMCFRICELRLKNICEVEIIVVWIELYKIVDR